MSMVYLTTPYHTVVKMVHTSLDLEQQIHLCLLVSFHDIIGKELAVLNLEQHAPPFL